jgi:hypothetical protein
MIENLFLKPAPLTAEQQKEFGRAHRHIHDPDQAFRPLAADGEHKPPNHYWLRRLRDGDVVEAEAPKAPAPAQVEESAAVTGPAIRAERERDQEETD